MPNIEVDIKLPAHENKAQIQLVADILQDVPVVEPEQPDESNCLNETDEEPVEDKESMDDSSLAANELQSQFSFFGDPCDSSYSSTEDGVKSVYSRVKRCRGRIAEEGSGSTDSMGTSDIRRARFG